MLRCGPERCSPGGLSGGMPGSGAAGAGMQWAHSSELRELVMPVRPVQEMRAAWLGQHAYIGLNAFK